MSYVVLAVTIAMTGVLLWAAMEKARALTPFASALHQLGLPAPSAPVFAIVVIAIEMGVALGLVYDRSPPVLAATIGLALAFAGAGLIALRGGKRIACRCFGAVGTRVLGRDQLAALPLWLGGVAILWWGRDALPIVSGTTLLAVVALAIASVRTSMVVRAAVGARGDRRSAREMYRWLNR